ncbi:MAG: ATP-binding cassette domain-containing protein [Huintestinicola sp.]|uniref:ATP-binding cassette domain-containing protein n=1 Tax=Huintestinicola sp. TaxID=2981661 RepID=UPI003F0A3B32
MSVIEIKNISKSFGKNQALSDVTLTLKENCIYGLLGRNGAGKSTLMNIIDNRIFADSGEILIDGAPNRENDKALGKLHMMSEQLLYAPSLKVTDMFKAAACFYPEYDMEYALKLSQEYKLNTKAKLQKLSTGYRSIAKIINALACNAQVVFLDEPVLGLDANHRDMFYRQLIEKYNSRPATFVISTHLIEEAAGLIERAVVIKDGRLLLDEDSEAIRSMGYSVSGRASLVDEYVKGKDVMNEETLGGLKTAYIKGDRTQADIPPELDVQPLSLQSLFIHLTNS